MKRVVRVWSVTVGLVFVIGVSVASAAVIAEKTDQQKLRKDVGKRGAKYIQCLVKAATKCEKGGAHSGVECHLNTGVVDYAGDVDLDPKNKQPAAFQGAVAKCDEKYTPDKKGTDYTGIGCPGDCNAVTAGVQQCANMAAYEATVESTVADSAKGQLGVLATAIDAACNLDTGGGVNSTDADQIACVTDNAATLTKYSKFLGKCYEKCENDYKDKKGNGGPNNNVNCLADDPANDDTFQTCVNDGLAKAEKKVPLSPSNETILLPLVNGALDDASTALYNRSDPTDVDPSISTLTPCGTCGNGTREGAEECDLADDVLCGGPCNADCTCP